MAVQLRLGGVPLLTPADRTLESKGLTVDGLNVHQEVVTDTEPPVALLALYICGRRRERISCNNGTKFFGYAIQALSQ